MPPTRSLRVVISGDSKGAERAFKRVDNAAAKSSASAGKAEKSFSNLRVAGDELGKSMSAAGGAISLVKFPAMIAGAGAAAQAVGALAAGGVALGASLAPLAGAGAGVAGGYLAMGQAAGVAKLAFSGLGDALNGNKDALKKLTPTQAAFVKQVQATAGAARGLRGTAQRGLLPGLTEALQSISPLFSRLRPLVSGTATVMGDLAKQAGALVGSSGVLDKLSRIGQTNIAVLQHGGTGAIAFGHALLTILDAARPLTLWFSHLAEKVGLLANGQANLAAKSGALTRFFDQTRVAMSRVGRIAADVAVGFFNIAKAGKPLGDELLVRIVRLAEAFKDWTQSASGKNQIAEYFQNARDPIMQIAGLVKDVSGAFLRLSAGPGAGTLIAKLRPLIPILEQVVAGTTAAFGPVLVDALVNVVKLFAQLAGTSGPLTAMVAAVGALAGALASLLQSSPLLTRMVVTVIGLVSATRLLTAVFGPAIAAAKALQVALLGEAAATNTAGLANIRARVALLATAAAMYVQAGATKIAAAGQWLLNAALTANPIGLVVVGLVALGAGLVVAYKKSETFRNVVNAAWSAIKSTTMAVLAWLVPAVKVAFGVVSDVVGVAVRIVRGYVSAYAAAAKAIVGAIVGAFNALKALPDRVAGYFSDVTKRIRGWISNFASAAMDIGKAVGKGIIDGLGDLGHLILVKAKDALGFVAKNIPGGGAALSVGKAIGSLVGDGVGKTAGALGGGLPSGAFGGGLKGARPSMAPFAAAASRFGLGVSSGLRPGAITSSGNVSYHSSGEAIDVAGPAAGMMGFFRQMKSKYGARLAELIYGPGKVGVKNGQPYNFGAALNAQHMDHVHVAYDTGAPGVGDGTGRQLRAVMTGDGIGFAGLESLWVRGGGTARTAPLLAHIAQAESGGNPNARNPSGASGLWQILGQPFKGNVFDPLTNAKMAVWKYKNQGLSAWAASRGTWGKYVGSGEKYSGSGSSSAGGGGGGKSGPKQIKGGTASGGALGGYNPGVVYAGDDSAAGDPFTPSDAASTQAFIDAQSGKQPLSRPLKGGGPTKGNSQDRQDLLTASRTFVSPFAAELKQLGAAGALAALTSGNADDIAVAQRIQDIRGGELDLAKQSGDPEMIQTAAENFKNAIDALNGLKDATQENTRALQASIDSLAAELKRQTDFGERVQSTENFQLKKYLADVISGEIGGRGVARRFTPGNSAEFAY